MHAKSLHSCPTLCKPMDYILPGSSVHGIPQARILKWVAIFFSIVYDCPVQKRWHLGYNRKLYLNLALRSCWRMFLQPHKLIKQIFTWPFGGLTVTYQDLTLRKEKIIFTGPSTQQPWTKWIWEPGSPPPSSPAQQLQTEASDFLCYWCILNFMS